VDEGCHFTAKGNFQHCKALILSPKLAGLPLVKEHKASVQDEEMLASRDEQGMNREPLVKHKVLQTGILFIPSKPILPQQHSSSHMSLRKRLSLTLYQQNHH